MTMHFPQRTIKINSGADNWGPHNFDLDKAIPDGLTVSAVTARAYLGRYDPDDSDNPPANEVATLIDSVSASSRSADVFFQHPGSANVGNYTIVLEVTLSNGASHNFYFYKVAVR